MSIPNTAYHHTPNGRRTLKKEVNMLMMRVRRMSERPMTKVGQLLNRLKRMFLLTVDQLMIKAREK